MFAELRPAVPGAHLLIGGDGPLKNELLNLIGQLDLEGSVHFAGDQAEAWKYLFVMDCFAVTSRSEGMPQAVLEAAIAGLPIIGRWEVAESSRTAGRVSDRADDPAALTRPCLPSSETLKRCKRWATRCNGRSRRGSTSGGWPGCTIDISSRSSVRVRADSVESSAP